MVIMVSLAADRFSLREKWRGWVGDVTEQRLRAGSLLYHVTLVVVLSTWVTLATANDGEGFCQNRYLSSAGNTSRAGSQAVGVAAILELRTPAGRTCGELSGVNLQVAAALLWAVQLLNGDLSPRGNSFIPGIHLELQVYDDCSQEILAASLVSEVLNIHPNNCVVARPLLAGVIGTSISPTTTRIASLLADTKVPQFGVSATLPELSDSSLYPSFFRTVPSDLTQSKVLVQVVTRLKWNYVAGMYTRDNYGTQGFQEFKRLAAEAGICVFREQSFLHSDSDMEDQMEVFIRMLLIDMVSTGNSLGVVYFGQNLEASRLFQMIQDRRAKWHDQQKFNQIHWVFSDGVGTSVEIAKKVTEYSSTFLSISPASLPLPDFRRFFADLLRAPQKPDPYWSSLLAEFIAQELPCDPRASSSCDVEKSLPVFGYLPATLDAIYSLAALLKRAHKLRCESGGGLCLPLQEDVRQGLLRKVQPAPFNYSEFFANEHLPEEFRNKRVLVSNEYDDFVAANMPLYYISIAHSGAWKKIGEYTNGSVSIDASADFTNVGSSECRTACTKCRHSDVTVFYHQPGDVLLLGLYSVHQPESPTSFRCGSYRGQSSSVVALEAFLQTLEALAADEGKQPGVAYPRVGGLVLDDCYNSLTAVSLLSGLFSKKINLTSSLTGEVIDMDTVVAVIGTQSSSVTLSSLSVLTPLRMPMISYSSTSPDLDDRISYPFFSRTVPSDSVQARALLSLAKLMNVTYLGAFHQNNNYGIRGMQSFIAMAEDAGVCVATSIPLEESTSQVELLSHLRYLGNQDVKVIVAFVTQPTAVNILDALQGYSVNFVFLASEAWGTGPATLQGTRGMKARGSLMLTVDTTREVGGVDMETYLKTLTPASSITDHTSWTRDMWEALMTCNLPGSFENEYPSACNLSARIPANIVKQLAHDQKVVQTINSVYSVVNALRSLCSSHSSQTAAADCAARVDGEELTRAIRTVELRDKSGQTFRPFLDSGNGNTGFTVYNVQKTSSGYAYVKVGSYEPSAGLDVLRGDLVFYNQLGQPQSTIVSSCTHKDRCVICNTAAITTTPGPFVQSPAQTQDTNGPLVVGVAVLGVVCVLLLLLLGVGVLLVRRNRVLTLKIFGRYGRRNEEHCIGNNGPESRRDPGRINSAFTPTSPRVSLPLPPLPTGDYDRCNPSTPSPSNSSQAARDSTASLRVGQTSLQQQQSPNRTQHPQFENLQQTEALQMQELWLRQRQQEENVSDLSTDPEAQGRPRSSSTPRPMRPNFLPLRVARKLDNHSCSSECLGTGQKSQSDNFRPRAWSDDAAAGKRLGTLTELDRQLIAYFINRQKQGFIPSSGVQDTSDPVRHDPLTALGAQYQGQQRRQSSPQHGDVQNVLLPHPTGDARPMTLHASRDHHATCLPVPAGGGLGHGMYLHAIPSCNSSLYLHAVQGSCAGLPTSDTRRSETEGHVTSAGSDIASQGRFVTSPTSPQSDASSSVFDSPPDRKNITLFAQNGGTGTRTPVTAVQAQSPTCTCACASADAATGVARFWKDSPQNAEACRPVASPEMLQQVATVPPDPAARDPGEMSGRTVMPVLVSPTGAGSGQCSIVYVPYAIVPHQDLTPSWQGQTSLQNDTRLANASPRVTAPNRRPRLGTGTLRDPRFSTGLAKSNSMSQQVATSTPGAYPASSTAADMLTAVTSTGGGAAGCESLPYIQGYQLTPVPPQCGPVLTNSNNSNQSSTVDSGTGEDIPATYIQDGEVVAVL